MCPQCSHEMRIVALIDDRDLIESILRHLSPWEEGVRVHSGAAPPDPAVIEPWRDEPFLDYGTEPVSTGECPYRPQSDFYHMTDETERLGYRALRIRTRQAIPSISNSAAAGSGTMSP